ncbi:hypothetical protein PR048_026164 [Dryococelus australis]|uniref:Uncharacterized protein n=1 Tax=Dryococelus australis TaxID=614101 RepID=A0ABQ9GKM9_9NEOP|nr:hypothetical protein PR048_026164 [Dryococelus australis]
MWAALDNDVLRAEEGENEVRMKQSRNARAGETGDPRDNPLTSGIVRGWVGRGLNPVRLAGSGTFSTRDLPTVVNLRGLVSLQEDGDEIEYSWVRVMHRNYLHFGLGNGGNPPSVEEVDKRLYTSSPLPKGSFRPPASIWEIRYTVNYSSTTRQKKKNDVPGQQDCSTPFADEILQRFDSPAHQRAARIPHDGVEVCVDRPDTDLTALSEDYGLVWSSCLPPSHSLPHNTHTHTLAQTIQSRRVNFASSLIDMFRRWSLSSAFTSVFPNPLLIENISHTKEKGGGEHGGWRLAYSPSTEANRAGSPDFRMWESCRTTQLVEGFSRGSSVFPTLSFRRCTTLTSITPIASQYLDLRKHSKRRYHSPSNTGSGVQQPCPTFCDQLMSRESVRQPRGQSMTSAYSLSYEAGLLESTRDFLTGMYSAVATAPNIGSQCRQNDSSGNH